MHITEIDKSRKWQLRCGECHHVRTLQTGAEVLTEAQKRCEACGSPIESTNIYEVKQEFLLE
jgi:rRNA maturation endonuclease Nob1